MHRFFSLKARALRQGLKFSADTVFVLLHPSDTSKYGIRAQNDFRPKIALAKSRGFVYIFKKSKNERPEYRAAFKGEHRP